MYLHVYAWYSPLVAIVMEEEVGCSKAEGRPSRDQKVLPFGIYIYNEKYCQMPSSPGTFSGQLKG